MGIYDRDYYRDKSGPSNWGIDGLTDGVKYLIIANMIVFLLQIFVVRERRINPRDALRRQDPAFERVRGDDDADDPALDPRIARMIELMPKQQVSVVQEWCELDTDKVVKQGQVWRLVTHAFCHDRLGLWHILFNMLGLFWFGCTLETMYGTREFLLFYFAAILVAGLAFVGLDLVTGDRIPAVGASGAVMAVLMLYAYHFPTEVLYVFWFVPVQIRFLVAIYAIWDLHPVLLALSGDRHYTGVGHAAHLGGLAFGFCYAKFQWHLSSLVDRLTPSSWASRKPLRRRPSLRIAPETVPPPERVDSEEVDRILRKISKSGQGSLTDEELATLHRASRKLKEAEEDRYPWE